MLTHTCIVLHYIFPDLFLSPSFSINSFLQSDYNNEGEIVEQEAALLDPIVLPELFANDATPECLAIRAYELGGSFRYFLMKVE